MKAIELKEKYPKVYERACVYCAEKNNSEYTGDIKDKLCCAFSWWDTIEGSRFWFLVYVSEFKEAAKICPDLFPDWIVDLPVKESESEKLNKISSKSDFQQKLLAQNKQDFIDEVAMGVYIKDKDTSSEIAYDCAYALWNEREKRINNGTN